jgi:prenylcysteine oxidase/farnesylcysteine lyase
MMASRRKKTKLGNIRYLHSLLGMKSLVFLLLLPYVLAFQLPFGVSALFSSTATQNTAATTPSSSTPRIAIIGAGAGGTSAAFWISKAKERFGLDVQIDVYEAADYIGGRASALYLKPPLIAH